MQYPLKLKAGDREDLNVISALLQDALVPLGDISYLPDEQSFILAVNRYRWEQDSQQEHQSPMQRIHAGLRFDGVSRVQYRGIDQLDRRQFLSLLSISFEAGPDNNQEDIGPGTVVLQFSGTGVIRLDVSAVVCVLSDFGEPWAAGWTPSHE